MRSGTKDCYVQIYRVAQTKDAMNATIFTPVLRMNAWCNAMARKGREILVDGQVQAESYMRFDFDYYDVVGVVETDFIEYEGVRYDIKGILPDIARRENTLIDTVAHAPGEDR